MRCANSKCHADMQDLNGGTMRMLELEVPPEERITRSEWGFPVFCVPTRYFWLCEHCSHIFRIRRWTPAGLVLEPRLVAHALSNVPSRIPTKLPVVVQRSAPQMMAGKLA